MRYDRALLADVAERIASTENRYGKLQARIERLKHEGSDPRQDEETLLFVGNTLRRLVRSAVRHAP